MYETPYIIAIDPDVSVIWPDRTTQTLQRILDDIRETFETRLLNLEVLEIHWRNAFFLHSDELENLIDKVGTYIKIAPIDDIAFERLEEVLLPELEGFIEHYLELLLDMGETDRVFTATVMLEEAQDLWWDSLVVPRGDVDTILEALNDYEDLEFSPYIIVEGNELALIQVGSSDRMSEGAQTVRRVGRKLGGIFL